jgi:hypothetical protein
MARNCIRNIGKNADGWYWEFLEEGHVLSRGLAASRQQAEDDAGKVELAATAHDHEQSQGQGVASGDARKPRGLPRTGHCRSSGAGQTQS